MDTVTADPQGAPPPPPPPPPPTPPVRRLTRSTDDRIVAGVAGGLGAYTGVDPVLFRIGFVIASFFGGTGLLVYALMWLIVPEDGTAPTGANDSIADRYLRDHEHRDLAFWGGVAALGLAAVLIAERIGLFASGWAWPVLLIGVGIALWNIGPRTPPAGDDDPSGEGPTRDDQPETPGTAALLAATDASADVTHPVPPYTRVHATRHGERSRTVVHRHRGRRRRERSYLGRLTVGAALIAVGIGSLLGLTGGQLFAVALGTIGVGLLVGAWVGRSAGLIVLGLALVPMTLLTNAFGDLPSPFGSDGAGERIYTLTSVEQLSDDYRLGAGQLVLDLSALELGDREVSIDVVVGAGQVEVLLPPGAGYRVEATARAGELRLPGDVSDSGFRVSATASGAGEGLIQLDIRTGVGEVIVRHASTEEVGA